MPRKNYQDPGQVKDLMPATDSQKNGLPNRKLREKRKKFLGIETKDKEGWLTLDNLTIVFTVLTVVFSLVTVVIAGVKISHDSDDGQEHAKRKDQFFDTGPVCVTCNKLVNNQNGQAHPRFDQLTKKVKNGVKMCCAEDWEQVSVLLMSIQQNIRQASQSVHSDLFKFSPVTAHTLMAGNWNTGDLTLVNEPRTANLNQSYNDPVTEHVRGLKIAEDGFVIPYSGVYYVYAGLLFKPNTTKSFRNLRVKELYGYIHRESTNFPGHSGYLIKMCHSLTLCDGCKDDEETVFSGGVFNFFAGDKV